MSRGVSYTLDGFLCVDEASVLGALTAAVASTGVQATRTTQIDSWKRQIEILRLAARRLRKVCKTPAMTVGCETVST